MDNQKNPLEPTPVLGTSRGEERSGKNPDGAEKDQQTGRTARDATSVATALEEPIDPRMPQTPPA